MSGCLPLNGHHHFFPLVTLIPSPFCYCSSRHLATNSLAVGDIAAVVPLYSQSIRFFSSTLGFGRRLLSTASPSLKYMAQEQCAMTPTDALWYTNIIW